MMTDGACQALHFGPSIISAQPLFTKTGEQHAGYMYSRTSHELPVMVFLVLTVVLEQFSSGRSNWSVGRSMRALVDGAGIIAVVADYWRCSFLSTGGCLLCWLLFFVGLFPWLK
jgi:hypothetical protein